jgi:Glucose / Sorbosone dehydrogenase
MAICSTGWACGGGHSAAPSASHRQRLYSDADAYAALVALPGGGLLVGDRLTGVVRRFTAQGRPASSALARVAVEGGGQRGLLGLARDGRGDVYASWTAPSGRIVVGRILPAPTRIVWRGPESAPLADGGHLEIAPSGQLVIGIGDLEDRSQLTNPRAPNGKLLLVNPAGPQSQAPRVLSSGWNNPFAFTYTPGGKLWVADNSPGQSDERLARGDVDGHATHTTILPPGTAPSGIAAIANTRLVVCGYESHLLLLYRISRTGTAVREGPPLARNCQLGVVRLAGGGLALRSAAHNSNPPHRFAVNMHPRGVITARPLIMWQSTLGLLGRRQWQTAAWVGAVALVATGYAGETIPGIDFHRMVAVSWWNDPTWTATSILLGLIAATFVHPAGSRAARGAAASGSGILGLAASTVMACPVCSTLAVPFLGAGGVLAFLRPDRGWLALVSVVLLAATLALRLRAITRCGVPRRRQAR